MPLDYAWRTFFSGVRDAVASDQPPRKRLEELCAATIDKLRGNEQLGEDILERVSRVKQLRSRISQLSEREVKTALQEIVSIYDTLSAHLYSQGVTKHAGV